MPALVLLLKYCCENGEANPDCQCVEDGNCTTVEQLPGAGIA
jgi:hypothetical protein